MRETRNAQSSISIFIRNTSNIENHNIFSDTNRHIVLSVRYGPLFWASVYL